MFIGHFAVGFGAKRYAPGASLAVLLAAALFPDLLWPPFLLLGWERVRIETGNTKYTPLDLVYYPWSHSLLLCLVWATAFALVYRRISHYRRGTIAIWIGVMSHWVLDWITHRPDMPLYPGGPRFGLGLWNSIAGTMAVVGFFGSYSLAIHAGTDAADSDLHPPSAFRGASLYRSSPCCTSTTIHGCWSFPRQLWEPYGCHVEIASSGYAAIHVLKKTNT